LAQDTQLKVASKGKEIAEQAQLVESS